MSPRTAVPKDIKARLAAVYEEVMWLAHRSNTSPSAARAWYTHIASFTLRRQVRRFSGKVSLEALKQNAVLRLEHFKRLQTTLTKLVAEHLRSGIKDPNEFVCVVIDYERVHIVTHQKNYEARKADGNYRKAGISLVAWKSLDTEMQLFLWKKVLKGKVANARDFEPPQ